MITTGIAFCIDMINALPAGDGISDTLSPATIVTGHEPPNVENLQLNFGDYVQLQMDNNPTNTMRPRHINCITLQPTGTTRGTYFFMHLHTGKRRHGRQWTKCAMTEGIISKVEELGRVQKQPVMHNGPIVTWRAGDSIAPTVVSDVDADAPEDDLVAPDQPLFLPLDLDAIEDVDVATVAPLRVLPADVGVENVQGAAGQGALAPADEEIEGVAYKVINSNDDDGDDDDVDNGEAEATEAPRYNLRRQQPPTFESYANPNGIDDVDLDLESSSFDFSISIDDTPDDEDSFHSPTSKMAVPSNCRKNYRNYRHYRLRSNHKSNPRSAHLRKVTNPGK